MQKNKRELLDSSFQEVKRLFVLAYDNTAGDNQVSVDFLKKYFLPRVKVENYNSDIDGRNFYDQPINDSIKQYSAMKQWSQKSIYRPGWWSEDWLLVGFCLFSKKIQTNCSWFKQTKRFTCWFKSNTTNHFDW